MDLTAFGQPDLTIGADEPRSRDDPQALGGSEISPPLHRRAAEGDEEIDRDRILIEFLQREESFDDLLAALAHSDDESAAW